MTTATRSNRKMVLANDFFSLLKTRDEFLEWMYRRISDFDMEINHDFYIFLSDEAAIELAKYETFQDREAKKILNEIIN